MTASRTIADVRKMLQESIDRTGSVPMICAGDVALLLQEIERLERIVDTHEPRDEYD